MSKKRKIDRFFEDEIHNGDNQVHIISFFHTDKYHNYIADREDYILNCEDNYINSPPNRYKMIPLKQESEYKHLTLVERLLLDRINFTDLYGLVEIFGEDNEEEVKDTLESLFIKGLISFKLTKQEYIEFEIDNYYSNFFKDF